MQNETLKFPAASNVSLFFPVRIPPRVLATLRANGNADTLEARSRAPRIIMAGAR
jgi:hypothetical protein